MKYFFYLITMLLLFSCDDISKESISTDDFLISKSAQAFVKANNDFAFEFLKEINAAEDVPNFMVSPVSLSLALGMAYNGANGSTKEAFDEVLNYKDLAEDVNTFNQNLMTQLTSSDDGSVMEIANAMWINELFPVKNDFIQLNQDYYFAEVANKDFYDPQTLDDINGWVSEKTHEKIPHILSEISPDVVLCLVNALYFNANWKFAFDKDMTYRGTFQSSTSSFIECERMLMSGTIPYLSNELFSSVILPYEKDKYSMVILQPTHGQTTDDIIAAMNTEKWNEWLTHYTDNEVTVNMPKFKLEYQNELNDELINMGLGIAFSDGQADFSQISDISTYISLVLQKTYIDVMESGTEAAAVTVISFEVTSTDGEPQPISFYLGEPFVYVIKENLTGSICFVGKVAEPEYGD